MFYNVQVLFWSSLFVQFHSHALTGTCFPGMYWVLSWECSCPKGGIIHNRWSDCVGYKMEIVCLIGTLYSSILQHFTRTMKPSDPLLLADGTLQCRMYPAGNVDISRHLAIPGFPQSDHTVGKLTADTGSLCSEA
jgi:hypothetical protein